MFQQSPDLVCVQTSEVPSSDLAKYIIYHPSKGTGPSPRDTPTVETNSPDIAQASDLLQVGAPRRSIASTNSMTIMGMTSCSTQKHYPASLIMGGWHLNAAKLSGPQWVNGNMPPP